MLDTYKPKYFKFKVRPQDFIVEEKLHSLPTGSGHVFYVFFEKKFQNTFDILDYLGKNLNLQRKHFWIWGLKDKFWITRQWISIYKRTLQSRWGPKNFLNILWKKAKILKTSWWNQLLKVGDNKWNLFFIRLRPTAKAKKLKKSFLKEQVAFALKEISKNWVPNYFWIQRFGKKLSNPQIGLDLIQGKIKISNPIEAQFKVQALASRLFNRYLDLRIKKWWFNQKIPGDIFYDIDRKVFTLNPDLEGFVPTGPLYWYNLVINENDAYLLEYENLKKHGLTWKDLEKFKKFDVYGLRRPIKIFLKDLRSKWQGLDLLLMFELPAGSYASVVVNYLDYRIARLLQD